MNELSTFVCLLYFGEMFLLQLFFPIHFDIISNFSIFAKRTNVKSFAFHSRERPLQLLRTSKIQKEVIKRQDIVKSNCHVPKKCEEWISIANNQLCCCLHTHTFLGLEKIKPKPRWWYLRIPYSDLNLNSLISKVKSGQLGVL